MVAKIHRREVLKSAYYKAKVKLERAVCLYAGNFLRKQRAEFYQKPALRIKMR